jgi:nucleoside-diphosphate-sugar epimerase
MTAAPRLVLVTGASGFIGQHLCAALAARGDSVRALYRRSNPPPELLALAEAGAADGAAPRGGGRVQLFKADLADEALGREAVRGVDAVIHSAALASDWGRLGAFMETNYEATARLLGAARDAGCGTFVYVSSAVVHGFGPHVDTTEVGPYYALKYPYQITKRMAEDYVLARNSDGFRTTAIRPCNAYGPGDRTSTYRMYDAILDGVFGYIGAGEALTCPVYIDDLCAGVLAALDRPEAAGEAIIITDGQKVAWKDYVRAMFAAVGSLKRPTGLPKSLAFAAAWLMTLGARALRRPEAPPLTMYRVEQGSQDYHFSNGKARELLGFEPRVFYEEGLARTAKAYLEERAVASRARAGEVERPSRRGLTSTMPKGDEP